MYLERIFSVTDSLDTYEVRNYFGRYFARVFGKRCTYALIRDNKISKRAFLDMQGRSRGGGASGLIKILT